MPQQARAFWVREPGVGEIRPAAVADAAAEEVEVRSLCSGISRGTETLVFGGRVPVAHRETMRAPFQEGAFPGPVKYGYLNVGVVERGPQALQGRAVFCLHPHQTRYVVPARAVTPLPDGLPPARAVLAGTVETALTAVSDAGVGPGDSVAVVGAGMVGCCVARLLAQVPGVSVTLVDVDPSRAEVAAVLGADFARPGAAAGGRDLVVHTSATSSGLQCSLDLLRDGGTVLELSWYGDAVTSVALGGAFHARRLTLRASRVGDAPSSTRRPGERLALAVELLRDPAYDVLLTGASAFEELPAVMARLASGELAALCHTVVYEPGEAGCSR